MHVYLICVRSFDDTYFRIAIDESMLQTPEMENLRKLAHSRGFRVDYELLSTIEDAKRFLEQLGEVSP